MTVKEQLMEFLAKEGFRPQDEDFGIYFRYEMLTFLIHWDADDEQFVKISLPGIFDTDENNRVEALEAANVVNLERKVVKAVIAGDSVWVTAEQLLDSTPNYEDIVPRTLHMLLQARAAFYEAIKKA